jgi:hypothetical protein
MEKNACDHVALERLCREKEEKDTYLSVCYERWTAVNEKLEQFKKEAQSGEFS